MATSPWRVVFVGFSVAITLWIWGLAGALFALRWTAIERPDPPPKPLFPYGEMRVGVDASYPPFAVAMADDLYGFDIDVARALATRLSIPVRFVNMGYDGLYDSLKADQVDVVISALMVDPTRLGDVRYTRPYFNDGLVLISRADNPLQAMDDLPGHSVAYEFGSEADLQAHQWLRLVLPFDTQPYELPQYALDAVRLAGADAALVDATSGLLYLREHKNWNPQFPYVTDAWYAIAVRIDHADMWAAVNQALESVAEGGALEAILEKWL